MNYDKLKAKLAEKDVEVKAKSDYSIKLFNLIKDDCLDIVISKTIERNFDGLAELYSSEIIEIILKKIDLDISTIYFDGNVFHGVESAQLFLNYRFGCHFVRDDNFGVAESMIEKIDYAQICTMLRKYIVSKGFKGKQYTHRLTGKTINSLDFTITRNKLESILHSNQSKSFDSDKELNDNLIGGVGIILICIIGFMYFILAR